MSKAYGDITMLNKGVIRNFRFEEFNNVPTFSVDDLGKTRFVNGELRINNGIEWTTVQYSNTSSSPLITTLGNSWINSDLSFNPTNFNALDNVSGLTANSNLFNVFQAFDNAITTLSTRSLDDLSDVSLGSPTQFDILVFDGTNYSTTNINVIMDAVSTFNTTKLRDVNATTYTAGDVLVFSAGNKFKNKKLQYNYSNTASNTSVTITHDLGVKYCAVTCINLVDDKMIPPSAYEVHFASNTQLTISFQEATKVAVVLHGVNTN